MESSYIGQMLTEKVVIKHKTQYKTQMYQKNVGPHEWKLICEMPHGYLWHFGKRRMKKKQPFQVGGFELGKTELLQWRPGWFSYATLKQLCPSLCPD